MKSLLTTQNAKTSKGEALGYLTGILYLAPADTVSDINLCPFASKGCKSACLYTAGRGRFSNVQQARINKTKYFRDNQAGFMNDLVNSIKTVIRKAEREGLTPAIRLNGTSDIRWETIEINGLTIFEMFPSVQFYDYTKDFTRLAALTGLIENYNVTFSVNESKRNQAEALKLQALGVNTAIVFDTVPETYNGIPVVDGDLSDLRFLDPRGVIVGLKAKGDAKKDTSGFVFSGTGADLHKVA